jgi:hypothetical protein
MISSYGIQMYKKEKTLQNKWFWSPKSYPLSESTSFICLQLHCTGICYKLKRGKAHWTAFEKYWAKQCDFNPNKWNFGRIYLIHLCQFLFVPQINLSTKNDWTCSEKSVSTVDIAHIMMSLARWTSTNKQTCPV